MSDNVNIMKITFHMEELEGRDVRVFDDYDIIRNVPRAAALRFCFEMYDSHGCCGFRVNTADKIAVGASSESFIYEIVEV